jgi:hypothetical protein
VVSEADLWVHDALVLRIARSARNPCEVSKALWSIALVRTFPAYPLDQHPNGGTRRRESVPGPLPPPHKKGLAIARATGGLLQTDVMAAAEQAPEGVGQLHADRAPTACRE